MEACWGNLAGSKNLRIVSRLRWDRWNVALIVRHAVTPDEVEEEGPSGVYYPVTARSASRQERRRHQAFQGVGSPPLLSPCCRCGGIVTVEEGGTEDF